MRLESASKKMIIILKCDFSIGVSAPKQSHELKTLATLRSKALAVDMLLKRIKAWKQRPKASRRFPMNRRAMIY